MPLRAQVDGVEVNAALLSQTEWQALKGSHSIRLPCCNRGAYRRVSRLGTRHFAHSPGGHCGALGESAEHLAAKAEIVNACHELGWDVQSEFACENWRADVYATKDGHRVVFEIQWSPQTLEDTRKRHAEYGNGAKCWWLFRKLPNPSATERDLPMFELSLADSGFIVVVEHTRVRLPDFVKARLERRIRFCEQRHYTVREVQLMVLTVKCWRQRCGTAYDVFYTRQLLRSDCGVEYAETDPGETIPLPDDPYSALRNRTVVKRFFPAEAKRLRVSVKRRWSNTERQSYWSFGCPECNALYGDHFFSQMFAEAENDGRAPLCTKQLPCSEPRLEPHWCFPRNGKFCGIKSASRT